MCSSTLFPFPLLRARSPCSQCSSSKAYTVLNASCSLGRRNGPGKAMVDIDPPGCDAEGEERLPLRTEILLEPGEPINSPVLRAVCPYETRQRAFHLAGLTEVAEPGLSGAMENPNAWPSGVPLRTRPRVQRDDCFVPKKSRRRECQNYRDRWSRSGDSWLGVPGLLFSHSGSGRASSGVIVAPSVSRPGLSGRARRGGLGRRGCRSRRSSRP